MAKITLPNTITTAAITLQLVEDIAIYDGQLTSSRGNLLQFQDSSTDLSFSVYKGMIDIINTVDEIEWKRFSFDSNNIMEDLSWGNSYTNKNKITITREDIDGKCLIQASAYGKVNNVRTCLATAQITIIDINEIYASSTPPSSPIDNMVWLNTSKQPPALTVWNKSMGQWIEAGSTEPLVKNLLRNSNFWKLNTSHFNVEHKDTLEDITIINNKEKNWAKLKSIEPTPAGVAAGISQTTVYPIVSRSSYTFSLLAYRKNGLNINGTSIYIKVVSVNKNGFETVLINKTIEISTEPTKLSVSFRSLGDTKNLKIIAGTEAKKYSEIYLTELSLYNANEEYPWELAQEDINEQLLSKVDATQENVFNVFSNNGKYHSIYEDTDKDGTTQYFVNASYIKGGTFDNSLGVATKDDINRLNQSNVNINNNINDISNNINNINSNLSSLRNDLSSLDNKFENRINDLSSIKWSNCVLVDNIYPYENNENNNPKYLKTHNKMVTITGSIEHDKGYTGILFTLPNEYRPINNSYFTCVSNPEKPEFCNIKIDTNGEVTLIGTNSTMEKPFVSLEITFFTN